MIIGEDGADDGEDDGDHASHGWGAFQVASSISKCFTLTNTRQYSGNRDAGRNTG